MCRDTVVLVQSAVIKRYVLVRTYMHGLLVWYMYSTAVHGVQLYGTCTSTLQYKALSVLERACGATLYQYMYISESVILIQSVVR